MGFFIYASNGVILKTIAVNKLFYTVEIDVEATRDELKFPHLSGKIEREGETGFSIEFIGKNGGILYKVASTYAIYHITGKELYIRCRATYCRKYSETKYEELYAWTQPVFKKQ